MERNLALVFAAVVEFACAAIAAQERRTVVPEIACRTDRPQSFGLWNARREPSAYSNSGRTGSCQLCEMAVPQLWMFST